MTYLELYNQESKPLSKVQRARVMKWALKEAKSDTRKAKAKNKKWLDEASTVSKEWRDEALTVPAEERALRKAGYNLLRGFSDHDTIATVHIYQVANGKRQWISDWLTPAWRKEEAKAEAWKRKILKKTLVKV